MKRLIVGAALALAASLPAWAQKTVTFAYQDMMNPFRWVQQTGEIEKATGYKINWRQFGGGGDVIRAMASGDVAIGEVGSTGVATAISQGMDVELFWILEDIAAAEALVVRNGSGVNTIADLKGKKIATPFVSTSHFQLLYALNKAGLKATDAQVLNMRPPEIAAAWGRGDIDATFIWDPVLGQVKKTGKVLTTSGDICKQGACTFDGLIVTRKFAKENPDFMVALVKALAKADADYRGNAEGVDRRRGQGRGGRQVVGGQAGRRRPMRWRSTASRVSRSRRRRRGSAAAPTAPPPRRWRSRRASSRSRAGCSRSPRTSASP